MALRIWAVCRVGLVGVMIGLGGCGEGRDEVEVTGEIISDEEVEAEEEAAAAAFPLATAEDLRQLALAYTAFWSERGADRGPEDVDELIPYLLDSERVIDLVRRGEIVVCWDAAMNDLPRGASRTVLAYARRTPIHGGPVVFADTGSREVTASEFAELPKASVNR
ncbi:MAG: hypothetical protein KatS3mg108_2458 [Isosphaeraceae bacterium]|nr:MAG: hypothetical protein KatS3mg108_2458 [Isosphaeraceae bacterium]